VIVLVGCVIIIGTLVGGAVLYVKLGNLQRALEDEREDAGER